MPGQRTRVRPPRGLLTLSALLAAVTAACSSPPEQPPPRPIHIATGTPNGPFHDAGEALARTYASALDDISPDVLTTGGGRDNVEMLEDGEAHLTFAYASVAYAAIVGQMQNQAAPFEHVRGIALLQRAALHVVAGPGGTVRRIEGLRGRRADLGTTATVLAAELTLEAFGLDQDAIRTMEFDDRSIPALLAGDLDAVFVLGPPAVAEVQEALDGGARLLPVMGAPVDQLLRDYPFYSAIAIRSGTYTGVAEPVPTIGINGVLLCSADLDDELVYRLTRALYEGTEGSGVPAALAQWLDVSVGAATPVPLHPGAARYYRERELPP